MIFIIGGEHQGKLEYTLGLTNYTIDKVAYGDNNNYDELISKPIIYNFHLLIKELLINENEEEVVKKKINEILEINKEAIIISNEIGCGIVPINKFDRIYRELVGRICCDIAKRSSEIYRVMYGIGKRIK